MKELVLMRHGAALSVGESGAADDSGRRLSPGGKDQVRISAERLKKLGFAPDVIISSPYLRAIETADIAALLFTGARRVKEPALVSHGSTAGILSALYSAAGGGASVLVAGHQPNMGALSGMLLNAPPPPFSTGSFAYFKFQAGMYPSKAELAEFFSPEMI